MWQTSVWFICLHFHLKSKPFSTAVKRNSSSFGFVLCKSSLSRDCRVDMHTAGRTCLFSPALLALFHFNEAVFPESSPYKQVSGKRGVFQRSYVYFGDRSSKTCVLAVLLCSALMTPTSLDCFDQNATWNCCSCLRMCLPLKCASKSEPLCPCTCPPLIQTRIEHTHTNTASVFELSHLLIWKTSR